MRATATSARALPAAYTIVIVTTDERVGPEAETHLASIYDVHLLQTWQELVSFFEKQPVDVVLLDIDTCADESEQGIAALAELRSASPELVLIAMTRSVSRKLRHQAIDAAVDDYFVAPVAFEEMRVVIGRLLEKRTAEIEYRRRQEEEAKQQSFAELIGGSEPMLMVYDAIKRISQSSTTVLIRGESGCGKELVARAIVSLGPRADKPFISINCAALPENLIETELFGHERGAECHETDAESGAGPHPAGGGKSNFLR